MLLSQCHLLKKVKALSCSSRSIVTRGSEAPKEMSCIDPMVFRALAPALDLITASQKSTSQEEALLRSTLTKEDADSVQTLTMLLSMPRFWTMAR